MGVLGKILRFSSRKSRRLRFPRLPEMARTGQGKARQGLHHPRFDVCEQALAWGAARHLQLVRDRAANLGAKPAP